MSFEEWLEENGYKPEGSLEIFRQLYALNKELKTEKDSLEYQVGCLEDEVNQLNWDLENPDWSSLFGDNPIAKRSLEEAYLKTKDPEVKTNLARFYEQMGLNKPFELKRNTA